MSNAPKTIYLQKHEGFEGEHTWCWHQVHDDDVQYVRRDLVPQWRDISEAPRDGTMILAYHPDYEWGPGVTFYSQVWGEFRVGGARPQPTHFMPVPEPPKQENE